MRTTLSLKIGLIACFFLMVFPAPTIGAGSSKQPAKQSIPSDSGYVFALAAADHFMHAWQTGDAENGLVMLSDGIRHSQDADKLELLFSNATDRAFEITRGHGHAGLYSFPVVLITTRGSHVARRFSEITLVETGKNDWVVDKLP